MGLKPHANPKRQRRGSARGQVCNFQFCDGQSRVACSATLGVPKAASDAAIWVRGVAKKILAAKARGVMRTAMQYLRSVCFGFLLMGAMLAAAAHAQDPLEQKIEI